MVEEHSGFKALGIIDMDTNDQPILVRDKTPIAANDTGTKGEICWDASFIYVCVDTDEWERVAIASW